MIARGKKAQQAQPERFFLAMQEEYRIHLLQNHR